ncbi:TonB-dependent receptor [uncultured Mucilaginibacter sp.]|uniref:SusC/RagA family TonB-linked outer membrane protein n=1 Tax=uncultured Mucilaginibacter sp. TaxID=797541 RepID=UPI0025F60F53|nr:TonB-dependent receptor [uncultured Mucilaginibacter sp.]
MFKSLLLKGRTLCLLLCCMVSSLVVTAQTKHTGKVIGADDKLPVVGASVRIKGTNTGAVTDVNGDFTLSLSPGNVIVVSYIGYVSQEVTVRGSEFVTISLQPASSSLNEVVVTGYTTQLKKDISGSVSVVDVADAKKIPTTSSEQLLQGQAAGVTVVNNGAPGAPSNVYIRGIGNFGNTSPLYVVDGAQVNDISLINPNDIESISVLKDAGAAAIYGVAGGSGVVVVTTKKGKAGKTTISYDGWYGDQEPLKGNVWHLMNPEQQSELAFRANDNATEGLYPGGPGVIPTYGYHGSSAAGSFGTAGVTNDSGILQYYKFDASNPGSDFLVQKFATGAGTDWFHSVFSSAPEMQHNITASGGGDKSTFLFSLNYLNQTGTLLNTYEKRYQARMNSNFKVNDHIRFGESGFATYRENQGGYPGSQQQEGGSIAYTYREMPIIPVFDVGGNYGGGYDGPGGEPLGNGSNPYAIAVRNGSNHARFVYVEGNMFAEADIAKYFTLHTNFGGRLYNQYYNDVTYNPYENYESHNNPNGIDENEQFNSNYNWTNTIQYKQTIGKHNIQVLAGYEQKYSTGRYFGASNTGLFSLDPAYAQLGDGTVSSAPYSSLQQPVGIESFFGKLDYVYDGKYILGASVRRDGVSLFYPGKQWGTFPSVSLAWHLSQEDFLKGVSWITDLKLRGSYGEAGFYGNTPGGNPYNAFNSGAGSSYYGIGGGLSQTQQGFYNSYIGNPNTTWENDKLTNIGLDASLFNHLDLTVEYYKKESAGLLFQASLPNTVGGATAPVVNIGDVQNKGIDISATYHDRINKDLTFSIGANITTYKNNITKETGLSNFFDSGNNRDNPIVRNQVGHPIGEFFGYIVSGVYQNASQVSSLPGYDGAAPGSFIYKDVDGDGKITPNDRTFMGNPNPNFTYGVNLNVSYKRFDFTAVLYGSQGNKDYNYTEYWTDFYSTFQGGKSLNLYNNAAIVSNGVVTNPSANLSAASFSQALGSSTTSSYYVQDGSFLKCRVLSIGYAFDPLLLKKIGFDKLRVYVQGTNLFTVTKYTGLDPELVSSLANNGGGAPLGIDYGAYPGNQKQYILGVNLTF